MSLIRKLCYFQDIEDKAAINTLVAPVSAPFDAVTKDLSDQAFDDGKPVTTEELLELAFAIQSMSDILHEETQDVQDLKSEIKEHREGSRRCFPSAYYFIFLRTCFKFRIINYHLLVLMIISCRYEYAPLGLGWQGSHSVRCLPQVDPPCRGDGGAIGEKIGRARSDAQISTQDIFAWPYADIY